MDGWKTFSFPFGVFRPIFRGKLAVSFRECNGKNLPEPWQNWATNLIRNMAGLIPSWDYLPLGHPWRVRWSSEFNVGKPLGRVSWFCLTLVEMMVFFLCVGCWYLNMLHGVTSILVFAIFRLANHCSFIVPSWVSVTPENTSSCYVRFHSIDDASVSFQEDSCHVALQKLVKPTLFGFFCMWGQHFRSYLLVVYN